MLIYSIVANRRLLCYRQGSIRINQSNQVEWASIEDGETDEKTALLGQIASRQKGSPDPTAVQSDINANLKAKSASKFLAILIVAASPTGKQANQ